MWKKSLTSLSAIFSILILSSCSIYLNGVITKTGTGDKPPAPIIEKVVTPTMTPPGDPAYSSSIDINVTISCSTEGAAIYYTTDGTEPTTSSNLYLTPIAITGNGTMMTIKAIGVKEGISNSDVATQNYIINYEKVSTPNISPVSGILYNGTPVIITCTTPGATIYYTIDGSDPTDSSPFYIAPFTLTDGAVVKAIAYKNSMLPSDIATREYSVPPPNIIYVKLDAIGNNDGTTWGDAFTSLQSGLEAAVAGKQIWVAAGTYKPSNEVGGSGDRYRTFQMKNGVAIYGGFTGTEYDLSQRDISAHETILSGDIGELGNNSDNVYHIFRHQSLGLNSTAVLDGFTLTGGNANGFAPDNNGGAIANGADNSPTISNCTFTDNFASNRGGAILNASSSPTITNCTFTNNSTLNIGAAICNFGSSSSNINYCIFTSNTAEFGAVYNGVGSSPVIANSTFANNYASTGGGAIHSDTSTSLITGCTFTSNSTDGLWGGGAIVNDDSDNSSIINSTFTSNSATVGGAIINHNGSTPTITGCTFSSNVSSSDGGALADEGSSSSITSSNFSSNAASRNGGAIYINGGNTSVGNSTFSGNTTVAGGGGGGAGIYDYYGNITITDTAFSGNIAAGGGGGIYNYYAGGTITGTTFTGNQAGYGGGGVWDLFSSAAYTGCSFINNIGPAGAGASLIYGSPSFTNCSFSGNSGTEGGGIRDYDSNSVISGCTLSNNTAQDGGGIWNSGEWPNANYSSIMNCTLNSNHASNRGGGLYNILTSTAVTGSTFSNNTAYDGAGVYNWLYDSSAFTSCSFTDNTASDHGGGLYVDDYNVITDPTFSGNSPENIYP